MTIPRQSYILSFEFQITKHMIAVIKTGGKQYIVKEKDLIRIEKLPMEGRGKDGSYTFSDVLLVSDSKKTDIGTPRVPVKVEAKIVRDDKAKKVMVVKYKAKVRYLRMNGHRQPYSEVKIDKISA